ncbi:hypothetical protein Hanom_Chr10g00894511 [Helianthus anomalus]
MKEKSAADELTKLAEFKETRSEWFIKEEKKKGSRNRTPKAQAEEGSSSQAQKKRKKKVVETLLSMNLKKLKHKRMLKEIKNNYLLEWNS